MRWILVVVAAASCVRPQAPPPVPAPSPPPAPVTASAPEQLFANSATEYAFADPERRRKLEATFAACDAVIEADMRAQKLPGMAYGIVVDGDLVHSAGFGVTKLGGTKTPDADTVFRIGSITKSFTALAILVLRDEGKLSLDDPLVRFIPEAAGLRYPTRDTRPITMRQLLMHTSGLPRLGAFDYARPDREVEEAEMLAALEGVALDNPPGTLFAYSNFGFGLLGLAAGRVAGVPLRKLLDERILRPLGMASTVWDQTDVPPDRLATAYATVDGKLAAVPHWRLGASEGSGGLYSSVRDMARYVALHLSAYPPRDAPDDGVIRRSSLREAHSAGFQPTLGIQLRDHAVPGDSLVDGRADTYAYGLGVAATCDHDVLVQHGGGTEGYRSGVAFLPHHGVGIVVLASGDNFSSVAVADKLFAAMKRGGGLEPREVRVPLSPELDKAMAGLAAVYETWTDEGYRALMPPARAERMMTEERVELAEYRRRHGACSGHEATKVRSPRAAIFTMRCERGRLDMEIVIDKDGLVQGFSGISRDVPAPPMIAKAARRVAAMLKRWDEPTWKTLLARHASGTRDDVRGAFKRLAATHGSCRLGTVRDYALQTATFRLGCQRGGDLDLVLGFSPGSDEMQDYRLEPASNRKCPVR